MMAPMKGTAAMGDGLVDSAGIARLVGSLDSNFALIRRLKDPHFPKPVSGKGVPKDRYLWDRAEIMAWRERYVRNKWVDGQRQHLDNAMAQLVIRHGWKRGGRAIARMRQAGVRVMADKPKSKAV